MSKQDDAMLREVAAKAVAANLLSTDEQGFIFALVKKYRSEIEAKMQQSDVLRGQIFQLQQNEKTIIDLMNNMLRAADRAQAREEAVARVKGHDLDNEVDETSEVTKDV